ncbi:MAG: helix-turn-helix transcriptional regulator [bacterium]|nr:helix-turn-helix transcriptional regulator [bacterium]
MGGWLHPSFGREGPGDEVGSDGKVVNRSGEGELLELDLRAIRELTGKTQEELAALASMTQSEVSRLERRSDYLVSTLQRIVRALGGELEVIANFGDKRVKLTT